MRNKSGDPTVIAFYLPQFHPIPENNQWWGKGFTEWTNVGKAKPLFPGHYQPKVPKDLGYYDLRMPETRIAQAELAKQYGVDGFCYWHYWFGNGKRLLEMPFTDVLRSGEPDFPFCLGWANHSWKRKTWSNDPKRDALLMEQLYPGIHDYEAHFKCVIDAFMDSRYIKIEGRPVFLVWEPLSVPSNREFMDCWNILARQKGFEGIYFIGFSYHMDLVNKILAAGYESVVYDALLDTSRSRNFIRKIYEKILYTLLSFPVRLKYSAYVDMSMEAYKMPGTTPCLLPNYDHTPRSGKRGTVLLSDPEQFGSFFQQVLELERGVKSESPLLFIKSWNEWGEGNYLEPDLKYESGFLEQIRWRRERVRTAYCPSTEVIQS